MSFLGGRKHPTECLLVALRAGEGGVSHPQGQQRRRYGYTAILFSIIFCENGRRQTSLQIHKTHKAGIIYAVSNGATSTLSCGWHQCQHESHPGHLMWI